VKVVGVHIDDSTQVDAAKVQLAAHLKALGVETYTFQTVRAWDHEGRKVVNRVEASYEGN
jgi:hypothetical protein